MPKLKRVGDADNRGGTDFIESLDRGLRVLEVFGGSRQPMTLSDLAKATDLPRATARRILFTLERAGFVATDGKLFRLMPACWCWPPAISLPTMSSRCCSPRSTGCRARRRKFRRWRSSMATTSSSSPAPARRGYFRRPRYRLPAAGVLHLGRPRAAVAVARRRTGRALDSDGARATDAVHGDRQETAVEDDHRRSRKGYSLVDREAEPGFRSISVPVRRYDGAIVAAINMGAHVDRVSSGRDGRTLLPRLREAAASVKSMLV